MKPLRGTLGERAICLAVAALLLAMPTAAYSFAILSEMSIDLNGNNFSADSFDSSNPMFSTGGQYDPAKARDNGHVFCNGALLDVGNARIYGHLATGPGGIWSVGPNGVVGSKAWHEAGDTGVEPGWVTDTAAFPFPATTPPFDTGPAPAGADVIVARAEVTSSNVTSAIYPNPVPEGGVTTNVSTITETTLPDPIPPGLTTNMTWTTTSDLPIPQPPPPIFTNTTTTTTGSYPAPGTFVGTVTTNYQGPQIKSYTYAKITSYTYLSYSYSYFSYSYTWTVYQTNILYTTNYYNQVFYSGDYHCATLPGRSLVLGQARVVVTSGLMQSVGDTLQILPGASLELYAGGSACGIRADGILTERAENLVIFCASSVTSLQIAGDGALAAVIVAPNAAAVLSGAGNGTIDLSGTLLARTVVCNGHVSVHYDESVARMFPFMITVQPVSRAVLGGQRADFSVSAMGSNLSYQWWRKSAAPPHLQVPIPGATNSTFSVVGSPASASSYGVVVSDGRDLLFSSPALLLVHYPPQIHSQSPGCVALRGSNVVFEVNASGTYPVGMSQLNYRWTRSGTELPGQTDDTLQINNVQTNHAGLYVCVVTNLAGTATSAPMQLQVYQSAVATLAAASGSGGEFQFSVTGVPTFRYVIEASTNLLEWFPVATNQSPFNFFDSDVHSHPRRFYRSRYAP